MGYLEDGKAGLWWSLGDAMHDETSTYGGGAVQVPIVPPELEALALSMNMNTAVRKAVFYVLLTSNDFLDAFDKLVKLSLSAKQGRQIILVVIDCAIAEKVFNPFYLHLATKLLTSSRPHRTAFRYAMWDRFRMLSSMSSSERLNLAKLLGYCVGSGAVSLAVVKAAEFGSLTRSQLLFFRIVFTIVFLNFSSSEVSTTFTRIADVEGLEFFRQDVVFFLKSLFFPKKGKKGKKGKGKGGAAELMLETMSKSTPLSLKVMMSTVKPPSDSKTWITPQEWAELESAEKTRRFKLELKARVREVVYLLDSAMPSFV